MADDVKEPEDKTVDTVNPEDAKEPEDKKPIEGEGSGDDDAEGGDPTKEAPEDKEPDAADTSNEDDAAEDKELDQTIWGTTGDEVGDSVLQMLQNSEMSVEDAKALIYDPLTEHGDPTKLDRDALVEKVGKAKATLVMAGIENYITKQNAKTESILKTVHEVAGDKDSWAKVAAWAKDNVSEADRADYNEMLDAGGAKAKFAAAEYVRLFNADTNNTSVGKTSTLEGDAPAGDQGEAITRNEYAERLDKAHRRGAKPAEIKEIQRARERGRKKGI